jgi:hypothetical protein
MDEPIRGFVTITHSKVAELVTVRCNICDFKAIITGNERANWAASLGASHAFEHAMNELDEWATRHRAECPDCNGGGEHSHDDKPLWDRRN